MTDQAGTCGLCGRLVPPQQRQCACGAIFREPRANAGSGLLHGNVDFGAVAPLVAGAGVLLLLVWVFAPPLALHYSLMPLVKVYLVVVIISSVLAVLAADRLQREGSSLGESALAGLKPGAWFALLLVAWPVAFPVFLRVYYEGSIPQRVRRGYVTTGLFLFALLIVPMIVRRQPPQWTAPSSAPAEPAPAAEVAPPAEQAAMAPVATEQVVTPAGASPVPAEAARPAQAPVPAGQVPAPGQPTPVAPQPLPATPHGGSSTQSSPDGRPAYGLSILPRKGN